VVPCEVDSLLRQQQQQTVSAAGSTGNMTQFKAAVLAFLIMTCLGLTQGEHACMATSQQLLLVDV
jgi:hypothetical protein